MRFRLKKTKETDVDTTQLDMSRLPKHVAIIMDGNGRWAKERGLARSFGHRAGVETMLDAMYFSRDLGIEAVSLYAFSTENWSRDKEEVSVLMDLMVEFFNKKIRELQEDNIQIRMMGDLSRFPEKAQKVVREAIENTRDKTGMIVNFALNCGSRDEILQAAKAMAKRACDEGVDPESMTLADFEAGLFTAGLPDPDLMIRTSGESRLSNFMLYQLSYTELYFSPVYWPDFDRAAYTQALLSFQNRDRRFGKA